DFPTDTLQACTGMLQINKCLGFQPVEVYKGKTDYIAVVEREELVRNLEPNLNEIAKLQARGLIVTSRGDSVDFVSRFFAPQSGIDEDPVTGSAYTSLIPLWSEKLGKREMNAKQLSKRGGQLICVNKGERSLIGGQGRLYLTGEISIE
ncbi:MAG TPA: PhzF family phenazine biosynthesis protein, partial [Paludibacter sp.]|nr:PhzF family phenazine biosynthesis protein [Paludibacter sp.]